MQKFGKENLTLVNDGKEKIDEKNSEKINGALDLIRASELPLEFTPPDELIEGIFVKGDGSVLYGDSNSGKTFVAIDMAASISRGIPWMGNKTEKGIVLYIAAESPASIQRRLQGYQKYYNTRLENVFICRTPLDLFSNDTDSFKIIQEVRRIEDESGQKVRFIVGDTLARLSAGANENSGQDMGIVIRHFDAIRTHTEAHFTFIHHIGKNAAAGQRGWSGVRAAIDTEIEISDSLDGRCIEITKQRDLESKGSRIGFRLEPVSMSVTKWGKSVGTCIVLPWDAPPKKLSTRMSAIAGAIVEYVHNFYGTNPGPIEKSVLVKHFKGRHERGPIYRELKKLVNNKQLIDKEGYIYMVPMVPNGTEYQ